MSGETSRQLVKSTHAIAKHLGIRYCTKCNSTRPTEGGKTKVLSDGRTRWECATCSVKTSPPKLGKK